MKKIYAILQQHRVKGENKSWSIPELVFCDESDEDAEKDCIRLNNETEDGYLEFKYIIKECNLY